MLILLAIFALLLLAGSLFPWNFQLGPALFEAAWNVMTSWRVSLHAASPRDLLLNLVIYVPIGFTGYLWRGWRSSASRWIWPLLAGLCLSFSIETLQLYFPPRAPGIVDVICNGISTMLGVILAAVFQSMLESRQIEWQRRYSLHLSSALLLLTIWISASAWPVQVYPFGIVPRIRRLLHPGHWTPPDSLEGLLPWLLAGCLLTALTGPTAARWWLFAVLPGLFFLRLLMPGQGFSWSYLGGALAAVLIFWLLPQQHRHAAAWLAQLWLVWIVWNGLRPYNFLTTPNPFSWVPFQDMLDSSWMPAIGVLLRKTWTYGAAFWLLANTRLSRRVSLSLTLACILAVEAAQCWLPGRSPGMTDPAIALIAGALLWLVDHRFAHKQSPLSEPQPQLR